MTRTSRSSTTDAHPPEQQQQLSSSLSQPLPKNNNKIVVSVKDTTPLQQQLGPAVTACLLLADWNTYGLSERVCYHFELTDALINENADRQNVQPADDQDDGGGNDNDDGFFGMAKKILECVPTKPWHRMNRKQKRALKAAIRSYNNNNSNETKTRQRASQRQRLPLKFNRQTRLYFAYELTRVAFCVDASPTLTSTFGFSSSDPFCCPMDRLIDMSRRFWTALAAATIDSWRPHIAVTVLAVYSGGDPQTSLLVRDFRVTDVATAILLSNKIEEWCLSEVETAIATRIASNASNQVYASSMRNLLDAGEAALSTLSSSARPCIVVATDCRSVSCDSGIDLATATYRMDIPVTVLDVSSSCSRGVESCSSSSRHGHRLDDAEVDGTTAAGGENNHMLNYDPSGAMFPLHLSDDSEAVFHVCRATGGSFFSEKLLKEASEKHAGVADGSVLEKDQFFAFKRHFIQPNAVQWYVLFTLSSLSPIPQSSWGMLPPPEYISVDAAVDLEQQPTRSSSGGDLATRTQTTTTTTMTSSLSNENLLAHQARTTFSNYIINPIPINEILLMRVKEGYRAKLYGQSTIEHDRVSIQFTLPLDMGTTIHYELSYKALPGHSRIGFAHIKIELSGDSALVWAVKNDFLHPLGSHLARPMTMAQQISARLCTHLRWIRKEDMLQSYLSPPKWSDQLSSSNTPFVRRLGSLTGHQRRRHFRLDELDCVCTGNMPWEDDAFLSEFRDTDSGEQQLIETITKWSTQTIKENELYVKQTDPSCGVAGYCVLEIRRSSTASRVFTIMVETFGGINTGRRHALVQSLRDVIDPLRSIEILPKQIAKFLVGSRQMLHTHPRRRFFQKALESQHNHASWDLVKDPELLPLLMKRRKEIGKYLLLESSPDHALFARLFDTESNSENPGNLVQYQLAVHEDKLVVDLHMESETGTFFSSRADKSSPQLTRFHRLLKSLKTRDQECGLALQCRTLLLQAFNATSIVRKEGAFPYFTGIKKLLGYTSNASVKLRFFHSGSGSANTILHGLTKEMLLSQTLGIRVAEIPIPPQVSVQDLDPGDWFVMEFDKQTISIVHLSLSSKCEFAKEEESAYTYMELTFFTFSISDLYNKRNETVDYESDDDHISEHLRVSEFSESIFLAHRQHYATAAFLALEGEHAEPVQEFKCQDFAEVMGELEFVEISRVLVAGKTNNEKDRGPRLPEVLRTVLYRVPGEDYCFFFKNSTENVFFALLDEDSDFNSQDREQSVQSPVDDEDRRSGTTDDDLRTTEDSISVESMELAAAPNTFVQAPIFVRFLLDDEPVTIQELSQIDKSSNLVALVSIFKSQSSAISAEYRKAEPSELEASHLTASLELSALLNAYVAEQNLERLRYHGSSIEEQDIQFSRECLRRARNVVHSTVDVLFYVAKTDSLVAASAPADANLEVDEGFTLLATQLLRNETFSLRPYGSGDKFLVGPKLDKSEALPYWCFVRIRRGSGIITVEVLHPGGPDGASKLMESVLQMVSAACHRVNQLLLLQALHRTRTASHLLVSDNRSASPAVQETETKDDARLKDGLFTCPIIYRTSFDLFHRCAASPAQVARKLEATVLHIFSVSNRDVFVYKDESGAIFYMRLSVIEETRDSAGQESASKIELQVHGVEEPGPSITQQLKRLLQKRLLQIAVDMLSLVLNKNPQYSWRPADISFVRSFEKEWSYLEEEGDVTRRERSRRLYALPAADPGMVLLFFRQNLGGSTFFHRLRATESLTAGSVSDIVTAVDDEKLTLDPSDFTFYYCASPSKLDPVFQSESTLTEKGAQYSRQAGSGIAIIEVSILSANETALKHIRAAIPVSEQRSEISLDEASLRLRDVQTSTAAHTVSSSALLKVTISDTALKRDVLHQWVALSLNQALAAWNVERHLERMQKGLLTPYISADNQSYPAEEVKMEACEKICPGLLYLKAMLETSLSLPHPSVLKAEYEEGIVRSSAVASTATDLVEKNLLDLLRAESTAKGLRDYSNDICAIRSSRSSKPIRVLLERDKKGHVTVRTFSTDSAAGCLVQDSPIDCPEYTFLFYSKDYCEDEASTQIPKLFEEVAVGLEPPADGDGPIESLAGFKSRHLPYFKRSFAFIFSVKRNRRVLLAYNWNCSLFKRVAAKLREEESKHLALNGQSVARLQMRSLGILAPAQEIAASMPKTHKRHGSAVKKTGDSHSDQKRSPKEKNDFDRPPTARRRAKRPQIIRRPKLVGKSVEGAAMQAVARSRARASSNRFRNTISSGQGAAVSPKGRADESRRDNKQPAERKEPSSGRKSRDHVAQDLSIDKEFHRARKEAESITMSRGLLRQSTLHALAFNALTRSQWQMKQNAKISHASADFIVDFGPILWYDMNEMLPVPRNLINSFLLSFGQFLVASTPGLVSVPLVSYTDQDGSVFLMGKSRNVRNCKGVVVVRLATASFMKSGKTRTFVISEGRILIQRRRFLQTGGEGPTYNCQSLAEKDAAGLGILCTDLHHHIPLRGKILDQTASTLERTMKSVASVYDYAEVLDILQRLIRTYPLRIITNMRSNYKCYEARIVLQSYQDKLIELFDGPTLFRWLSAQRDGTDLIHSGENGLCFKREIVVGVTHSICFLSCDKMSPKRMKLSILCRTQGKDLHEFMFREGSNVAISILDNIAVEAAALAKKVLRFAASSLRKDKLWARLSSSATQLHQTPSLSQVSEMLHLCSVKNAADLLLDPTDKMRFAILCENVGRSGIGRLCVCLRKDPSFVPAWVETGSVGNCLFYVLSEDVFLMVGMAQETLQFHVVQKECSVVTATARSTVVQKLANFLLHFLWRETIL